MSTSGLSKRGTHLLGIYVPQQGLVLAQAEVAPLDVIKKALSSLGLMLQYLMHQLAPSIIYVLVIIVVHFQVNDTSMVEVFVP